LGVPRITFTVKVLVNQLDNSPEQGCRLGMSASKVAANGLFQALSGSCNARGGRTDTAAST
jgi:hypothetical protein